MDGFNQELIELSTEQDSIEEEDLDDDDALELELELKKRELIEALGERLESLENEVEANRKTIDGKNKEIHALKLSIDREIEFRKKEPSKLDRIIAFLTRFYIAPRFKIYSMKESAMLLDQITGETWIAEESFMGHLRSWKKFPKRLKAK